MKGAIAIGLLLFAARDALGDGEVNFNNNAPFLTVADRRFYDACGQPLVGTFWGAQLYYGPVSAAEANLVAVSAAPARFRVPTTTLPGTWIGGTRTLLGFRPGDTVTLQVRVWDVSRFPDFASAVAAGGLFLKSAPFNYTIPAEATAPAFAYLMENLRGAQPLGGLSSCSWLFPEMAPGQLAISWTGARLQRATSLSPPNWQDVTNSPYGQIIIKTTEPMEFFRVFP